MTRSGSILVYLATATLFGLCVGARAQSQEPGETKPVVDQAAQAPQQRGQIPPLVDQFAQANPADSELRTVASVLLRNFGFEEYQFRSAAEAMPADKYGYRPTQGDYGGVYPGYGPK